MSSYLIGTLYYIRYINSLKLETQQTKHIWYKDETNMTHTVYKDEQIERIIKHI